MQDSSLHLSEDLNANSSSGSLQPAEMILPLNLIWVRHFVSLGDWLIPLNGMLLEFDSSQTFQ